MQFPAIIHRAPAGCINGSRLWNLWVGEGVKDEAPRSRRI